MIKIKDIKCIKTAPCDIRLVIVKIITTKNDLYGLGCATFTQRPSCVVDAIETYLKPFLIGRNVSEIKDIWKSAQLSSYWRNGPVLNNALSGIDQALWDIKGKIANMSVIDLLGGKCRKAVPVYVHASGNNIDETIEDAKKYVEKGFKYIRLQCSIENQSTYGTGTGGDYVGAGKGIVENNDGPTTPQTYFNPSQYVNFIPKLFKKAREILGDEVELLHDVHERVSCSDAIRLAKSLEPYHLFFLEDILPPEELDHFKVLRNHSSTPLAMGELFTNQAEYLPLIKDRLIDFIRVHMSDIGGLTPCIKLASLCEFFGVKLALHGPGDTSPIGMAANLAIDYTFANHGIQEWHVDHLGASGDSKNVINKIFSGVIEVKDGCAWANDKPGWGIDINEEEAAKYPWPEDVRLGSNPCLWPAVRAEDGSIIYP